MPETDVYVIVYIVDGEPTASYGPFKDATEAALAFEDIRDWEGADPSFARTIKVDGTWSYDGS